MDPGSLTLALPLLFLLFPLLLSARDPPSPSPSPSPSPRRTRPHQVASTSLQLPPPPPSPPPPPYHRTPHVRRDHPPGALPAQRGHPRQLNLGEKVGLAFLVVAVVLQVALGGLLVFKRLQLRKMARGDRRMAAPSSIHTS